MNIDDPLTATAPEPAPEPKPKRAASRRRTIATVATPADAVGYDRDGVLFIRVPQGLVDRLDAAAEQLNMRATRVDLVAALILEFVRPEDADRQAALRQLVGRWRGR